MLFSAVETVSYYVCEKAADAKADTQCFLKVSEDKGKGKFLILIR
jgi:hypothetical protein